MQDIEAILTTLLRQPPAEAGMRLRSDRELAELCGVNRMRMRRVMDRLEAQGVLVRRHGSGTYLRKVPERSATGSCPHVIVPGGLTARDLAAAPARSLMRRHLSRSGQQLNLALIGGRPGADSTAANRLLVSGMVEQARQAGHHILFPTAAFDPAMVPSVAAVQRALSKDASDGYLVYATWAGVFREALQDRSSAAVFFYPGKCAQPLQPLIEIETDAGIGRAVRVFAAQGLSRIAMLGSVERAGGIQDMAYGRAMEDMALSYQASEFVNAPWKPDAVQRAMRRLFDRADPPQAVYISDDHCLEPVARFLAFRGVVSGRDVALITLSNRGVPLVAGVDWSRMEFDPQVVGSMAVDSLLKIVRTAGQALISFAHLPTWRPGGTHALSKHVQGRRLMHTRK